MNHHRDIPASSHSAARSHVSRWRAGLIIAIVALNASLAAFAFATSPTAPTTATTATITITDTVAPAALTVAPGTNVVFQNSDTRRHRIRTHSGPRRFDTGTLRAGESATIRLTREGVYAYADHVRSRRDDDDDEHEGHHGRHPVAVYAGTITVSATGGPPSGGGGTPPPVIAPSTASVALAGEAFTPRSVTIAAGGTVTWNNNDGAPHTVTASDASFDSGIMARGATFQRTFPAVGTFAYVCDLHSGMRGTIVVVAPSTIPPPTPTTTTPTTPTPTTTTPVPPPPTPTTPTTTTPSPPVAAPTTASVSLSSSQFVPANVTIQVGGTVTWTNAEPVLHTVTAVDTTWDSGILAKSTGTYQRTFTSVGSVGYLCSLHPGMTGTVTVVDATTPPPTTTTTPTTPTATTTTPVPPPPTTPPTTTTTTPAALPTLVSVAMAGSQFGPRTVSVAVGGTVRWTNNDTVPHTVTASNSSFDSGLVARNATFERVFPTAGTYAYVCDFHSNMTGTVVVAANAAAAATVAATAATTVATTKATTTKAATAKTKVVKKAPANTKVGNTADRTVAPATATVSMKGSKFGPANVTIRVGGTVTWVNDDTAPHTVTASDGSFDSGLLAAGARYEHTYGAQGSFAYTCTFHPGMVGTVVVVAAATAAPTRESTTAVADDPGPSGSPAPAAAPPTPAIATSPDGQAGPPATAAVAMGDNTFTPAALTVTAGTNVTFTNVGKLPHTVTATDRSFDSKIVMPGAKWSSTFAKVGTFAYDCIIHPGMSGSVTVTEAPDTGLVATGGPGSGGGAAANASGAPGASQTIATQSSASYRGMALMVSGIVILAGVLYMVGMLIAEDPRWRRAAVTMVGAMERVGRLVVAHVVHPFRPRPAHRIILRH